MSTFSWPNNSRKKTIQYKLPIVSLNVAGGDDLKVLNEVTLMEYASSLPKEVEQRGVWH